MSEMEQISSGAGGDQGDPLLRAAGGTEWGAATGAFAYQNDNPLTAKHTSKFWKHTLPELKEMVSSSSPSTVRGVGEAWEDVGKDLDGNSAGVFDIGSQAIESIRQSMGAGGGIKGTFDRAIAEVREHWDGKAAKMFEARAREISKNIAHAAEWARQAGACLSNAAGSLEAYGPYVMNIEEPDGMDSFGDRVGDETAAFFGGGEARDDGPALASLEAGTPTDQVLESTGGQLSAGREAQLRGAIAMEMLGASYNSVGKALPSKSPGGPGDPGEDREPWKGDPPADKGKLPNMPPPPPPGMRGPTPSPPGGMPSGPKGPGYSSPHLPTSPRPTDVPHGGGSTRPTPAGPHMPGPVRTGLEGLPDGGGGGGGGGGDFNGPGLNGGVKTPPREAGGGGGGGNPGMPGMPGGGSTGTPRGGAGTGRAGMPGMGAGAGAGGAKGGGAGGRGGAMARQRGGAVGAAKKMPGAGAQGGSGLHRSRGGSQAGRPGGMAGQGAPGANGKNKNSSGGNRPDYLVEEEDTWIKQRNVVPRVIE
ncbi:hypothetical protein AB0D04_20465 [Streptomyces sp. NPDC048483]|uniref:hypothetical protein n=1 Tax=Streptomyces sp. NPDC048483 TaxID=3154927 RepID=UPI003440C67A